VAVIAGVLIGMLHGARRRPHGWSVLVLTLPFALAALEVVVNARRFGWTAMVVWAPILVGLTLAAMRIGVAVGSWVRSLRHRRSSAECAAGSVRTGTPRRPATGRCDEPHPAGEPWSGQDGGAKNSRGMPSGSRKLSPEP
jgi:hypothetical protein